MNSSKPTTCKSRRVSAGKAVKSVAIIFKDEPSESEHENTEDEDDDEYGKRTSKKRKITSKVSSKKSTTSGKLKAINPSLSILPTLSLDVLFEIFGHLQPSDLLNLAQTSASFRSTLLSSTGVSIWKAARAEHKIIDPPPGMSETRWAKMLFNGYNCEACSTTGVRTIEFGVRRRVCKRCRRKHLTYSKEFEDKYPDYDLDLMNYIPYTRAGPGVRAGYARHSKSKFFWDADVHSTHDALSRHMKAVSMRIPGAQNALKEWKKERMEFVEAVNNSYVKYRDWYATYEHDLAHNKHMKKLDRQATINDRLRALGHEDQDLITYGKNERKLTEEEWVRIRPILEGKAQRRKALRLKGVWERVVYDRLKSIETAYKHYKNSIDDEARLLLPPVQVLYLFEPFLGMIDMEGDGRLQDAQDQLAIRDACAPVLEKWTTEKREQLSALLPSADINLDLAVSVFKPACASHLHEYQAPNGDPPIPNPSPRLGFPSLVSHLCWIPWEDKPQDTWRTPCIRVNHETEWAYDERGSDAIRAVIELLGMDVATTTQKDLLVRDARFWCASDACAIQDPLGFEGSGLRKAFTADGCAAHYMEFDDEDHQTPRFGLLDPEREARIIRDERHENRCTPNKWESGWDCMHCTSSVGLYWYHLQSHLKMFHDVEGENIKVSVDTSFQHRTMPLNTYPPRMYLTTDINKQEKPEMGM